MTVRNGATAAHGGFDIFREPDVEHFVQAFFRSINLILFEDGIPPVAEALCGGIDHSEIIILFEQSGCIFQFSFCGEFDYNTFGCARSKFEVEFERTAGMETCACDFGVGKYAAFQRFRIRFGTAAADECITAHIIVCERLGSIEQRKARMLCFKCKVIKHERIVFFTITGGHLVAAEVIVHDIFRNVAHGEVKIRIGRENHLFIGIVCERDIPQHDRIFGGDEIFHLRTESVLFRIELRVVHPVTTFVFIQLGECRGSRRVPNSAVDISDIKIEARMIFGNCHVLITCQTTGMRLFVPNGSAGTVGDESIKITHAAEIVDPRFRCVRRGYDILSVFRIKISILALVGVNIAHNTILSLIIKQYIAQTEIFKAFYEIIL